MVPDGCHRTSASASAGDARVQVLAGVSNSHEAASEKEGMKPRARSFATALVWKRDIFEHKNVALLEGLPPFKSVSTRSVS